jgi:hypothetical protein
LSLPTRLRPVRCSTGSVPTSSTPKGQTGTQAAFPSQRLRSMTGRNRPGGCLHGAALVFKGSPACSGAPARPGGANGCCCTRSHLDAVHSGRSRPERALIGSMRRIHAIHFVVIDSSHRLRDRALFTGANSQHPCAARSGPLDP